VAIADWAGAVLSAENPETLLEADGTTPTPAGVTLFTTTINSALRQFVPNSQANLANVNFGAGGDNAGAMLGFLIDIGYTAQSAAAIVGNLQAESFGLNPLRFEAGVGNNDANAMEGFRAIDANGNKTFTGGFGIGQWTSLGRVQALQNHADTLNLPVTSLELQTRFLAYELETYLRGGHRFRPSDLNPLSLEEATWVINRHFFTPCASFCTTGDTCLNHAGGCQNTVSPTNIGDLNQTTTPTAINGFNRRLEFAQQALGITPTSMQFGSGNCVGSVSAWSGVGFPHYNQCDSRWGSDRFGSSTICAGGCGPVSFAMMAAALLGRDVPPPEVVAMSHHMHVAGVGSSHAITGYLAGRFGLQHRHLGDAYSISQSTSNNTVVEIINRYLREGWLIHSTGGGSFGSGAAPYSTGGHYVAIRGVTENGMWLIADSASGRDQNRLWNPSEVFAAGMNKYNLQAVGR
jgi:hypothetical protein